MGVLVQLGLLALQAYAARLVAFDLELFADDRDDFIGEETGLLRRHCLGEGCAGESVYVFARDAVLFGQVLGGLDHVDADGRVFQRLPHVVLEADRRAELEASAVVERGNRIARHALGADHQRDLGRAALNLLAGLAEQLEAGAANALRHLRRHFHRHAGVQADVARQKELVEVAGRHVAGDHGVDVGGRDGSTGQRGARRLDAQVGGRDMAQRAAVIDHGRAHAVEQVQVLKGVEEAFLRHGVVPV